MNLECSEEFSFTPESIKQFALTTSGVYEILQSAEYPRYEGDTRVLKVGMSKSDLRRELLNHLVRHTAAKRLARICRRQWVSVTFRLAVLDPARAIAAEKELLRDFEDKHWELPVLNSQRGYKRDEDRHYRG